MGRNWRKKESRILRSKEQTVKSSLGEKERRIIVYYELEVFSLYFIICFITLDRI